MAVPTEVTVVRLYYKSPGTQSLRKSAAAELAHLMAAGWQEKHRKAGADHVVLRLERPRPARPTMPTAPGGGPGRPRR
ncbi:MAG: hypothetical protein AB1679_03450 [Actinomycetota bacterium]|jgi:hypothetical protein